MAKPPTKPLRSAAINARLDESLRKRLDAINARHGTNDTIVLNNLLSAFCESVEEVDAVRWPAVVLLAEKQELRAAEDPPDKRPRRHGAGPDADVRKPA